MIVTVFTASFSFLLILDDQLYFALGPVYPTIVIQVREQEEDVIFK